MRVLSAPGPAGFRNPDVVATSCPSVIADRYRGSNHLAENVIWTLGCFRTHNAVRSQVHMPFHDLRIAVRHLRKSPGFTATAVLMLALGVGATTAIFSIVEGVLLRPLPFPNPERLVQLGDILEGVDLGGSGEAGVTAPDIQAYTRDTHSFESLGGYAPGGYELSGIGDPAQVTAARLSSGVFPTLEVAPLIGRFFTKHEGEQNEAVTVVSYSLWQNRLHGDPRVLGTKILLDRKPYEVIGVMPRTILNFHLSQDT